MVPLVGSGYVPPAAAGHRPITVTRLLTPDGDPLNGVHAINEAGQVVGAARAADGSRHAVLWDTDGRPIDLGTLGGDRAEAYALNDRGQVVGRSTTPSGEWHAFPWEAGRMVDLNVLASDNTTSGQAEDINERGQIAGTIWDRNVPSVDFVAVVWSAPPRR